MSWQELERADVALDELAGGLAILQALMADRRRAVLLWLDAQRVRPHVERASFGAAARARSQP